MNESSKLGQRVLGNGRARAGFDVDDPETGLDLHDWGLRPVLGARVDVALDAGAGERGAERPHVDVHAAAVAGPRLRERRRVHREHSDACERTSGTDRTQGADIGPETTQG